MITFKQISILFFLSAMLVGLSSLPAKATHQDNVARLAEALKTLNPGSSEEPVDTATLLEKLKEYALADTKDSEVQYQFLSKKILSNGELKDILEKIHIIKRTVIQANGIKNFFIGENTFFNFSDVFDAPITEENSDSFACDAWQQKYDYVVKQINSIKTTLQLEKEWADLKKTWLEQLEKLPQHATCKTIIEAKEKAEQEKLKKKQEQKEREKLLKQEEEKKKKEKEAVQQRLNAFIGDYEQFYNKGPQEAVKTNITLKAVTKATVEGKKLALYQLLLKKGAAAGGSADTSITDITTKLTNALAKPTFKELFDYLDQNNVLKQKPFETALTKITTYYQSVKTENEWLNLWDTGKKLDPKFTKDLEALAELAKKMEELIKVNEKNQKSTILPEKIEFAINEIPQSNDEGTSLEPIKNSLTALANEKDPSQWAQLIEQLKDAIKTYNKDYEEGDDEYLGDKLIKDLKNLKPAPTEEEKGDALIKAANKISQKFEV